MRRGQEQAGPGTGDRGPGKGGRRRATAKHAGGTHLVQWSVFAASDASRFSPVPGPRSPVPASGNHP